MQPGSSRPGDEQLRHAPGTTGTTADDDKVNGDATTGGHWDVLGSGSEAVSSCCGCWEWRGVGGDGWTADGGLAAAAAAAVDGAATGTADCRAEVGATVAGREVDEEALSLATV